MPKANAIKKDRTELTKFNSTNYEQKNLKPFGVQVNQIKNMKTLKSGQKVLLNNEVRTIYDTYPNQKVSLCLIDADGYEYEDVEEDFLTSVEDIKTINN